MKGRKWDKKRVKHLWGRILFHAPQAYCPLWGAKSERFWFSAPSMEFQDFHLRPRGVVVIHSWLLQGLISHEWGTSPTDVGQRCQAKMATRQSPWPKVKILDFHTRGRETKSCGLGPSERTISLRRSEERRVGKECW